MSIVFITFIVQRKKLFILYFGLTWAQRLVGLEGLEFGRSSLETSLYLKVN